MAPVLVVGRPVPGRRGQARLAAAAAGGGCGGVVGKHVSHQRICTGPGGVGHRALGVGRRAWGGVAQVGAVCGVGLTTMGRWRRALVAAAVCCSPGGWGGGERHRTLLRRPRWCPCGSRTLGRVPGPPPQAITPTPGSCGRSVVRRQATPALMEGWWLTSHSINSGRGPARGDASGAPPTLLPCSPSRRRSKRALRVRCQPLPSREQG